MTRLFIVRHGETDWNAERRLQGSTDIELNDVGREQALKAARSLGAFLVDGATIVTSPMLRARETTEIMGAVLGMSFAVDDRLRERAYGPWEGMTESERREVYPAATAAWHEGKEPSFPGYEGHARVADRVTAAIREHVVPGGDLVVVTHGSASRLSLNALLGLPLGGRAIGTLHNAAWSGLALVRVGVWSLERHNVGAA